MRHLGCVHPVISLLSECHCKRPLLISCRQIPHESVCGLKESQITMSVDSNVMVYTEKHTRSQILHIDDDEYWMAK